MVSANDATAAAEKYASSLMSAFTRADESGGGECSVRRHRPQRATLGANEAAKPEELHAITIKLHATSV